MKRGDIYILVRTIGMSRSIAHPLLEYHFRPTVGVFGSESSSDRLVIALGIFCYDVINQLTKGVRKGIVLLLK